MERADSGGEIFAVGGGRGEASAPIDAFALSRTGKPDPSVCFLPTASGDDHKEIDEFYAAFEGRASTVHLSLFRRSRRDLADTLKAADMIVIGGGNAANLLVLWRLHGLDTFVLEAHRRGALIVGFSAGASVLFERSITDSFGALRTLDDGLGLLPGTFCAHYASPRRALKCKELACDGFAVDDGAALHFAGGEDARALAWQRESQGYALSAGIATPLPTRPLGEA